MSLASDILENLQEKYLIDGSDDYTQDIDADIHESEDEHHEGVSEFFQDMMVNESEMFEDFVVSCEEVLAEIEHGTELEEALDCIDHIDDSEFLGEASIDQNAVKKLMAGKKGASRSSTSFSKIENPKKIEKTGKKLNPEAERRMGRYRRTGILGIPKGKKWYELDADFFKARANKVGYRNVMRGLVNLFIMTKGKSPVGMDKKLTSKAHKKATNFIKALKTMYNKLGGKKNPKEFQKMIKGAGAKKFKRKPKGKLGLAFKNAK